MSIEEIVARAPGIVVSRWLRAGLPSVLCIALAMSLAVPARAGSIFDFLFGGFHAQRQTPSSASSYAEPSPPSIGRVAPPPMGAETVRQGDSGTGLPTVYCVRTCDGAHFPLEHMTNATPVETCRAMCPASKTKVFFGSEIGAAVARDGQRYADLDAAFLYRKQLVPNCTCNGKSAFGLAPFDMTRDSTLRPGDIVATKDGFISYNGNQRSQAAFTPVDKKAIEAELMPPALRGKPRRVEPAVAENDNDDPGTIVQSTGSLPDPKAR
jgi:hypothetical protein